MHIGQDIPLYTVDIISYKTSEIARLQHILAAIKN